MDKRQVEGALIDSYVAAYYKSKFGNFRVNSILSSNKAYGLVLGERLSSAWFYDKFTDYLERNKAQIIADIEANSDTLTVSKLDYF